MPAPDDIPERLRALGRGVIADAEGDAERAWQLFGERVRRDIETYRTDIVAMYVAGPVFETVFDDAVGQAAGDIRMLSSLLSEVGARRLHRMICDEAGAAWRLSFAITASSISGDRCAKVPTAPDSLPTRIVSAASLKRASWRATSS